MFFIVMFLFYYNHVPCVFFIIFMLLVILVDISYCIVYRIVNKDLSSYILLVFNEYSSDVKTPTYCLFSQRR